MHVLIIIIYDDGTYRPCKIEMKRYRRGVGRQCQAVFAEYGRDDIPERARGVHVYVGLVMFQARPELSPAWRAAHATAAQSRRFAAQLIAERFYPQLEHAVTTHLCKTKMQRDFFFKIKITKTKGNIIINKT